MGNSSGFAAKLASVGVDSPVVFLIENGKREEPFSSDDRSFTMTSAATRLKPEDRLATASKQTV